ncbi:O-antigen ligase family protein [Naasia lichenicola]|uniref:O-antigen ligase family protein n=1 Tax=Naasia lichenicola TaxID=2565933 RepID=A0A4S4FNG9_9MICO|nr:O-antigen ligase family protein [Naasia lichenicola]THG30816.1 O-antigen ligase family protein [Naasia lichenicola]
MTVPKPPLRIPSQLLGFFGSAPVTSALTTTIVATIFFTHVIRSTIAWPGLVAILIGLTLCAALSLAARRDELNWQGVLPLTLLLLVGWSAASLTWSEYSRASLTSVLYQLAIAFLAVYVAVARDLIQIVRAFGDVLRVVLVLSLALEILSGLLIDTPISFLGILGNLAGGGPIQGIVGTRNMLGIVAVIAGITFAIELTTRSVPRGVAIGSLIVAGLAFLLTRSPVAAGAAVVVLIASAALIGIRRASAEHRPIIQLAIAAASVVGLFFAYALRARVVDSLNAGGEFEVRYALWQRIIGLTSINPLEGFGWIGTWRTDIAPYFAIDTLNGREPTSALNAFIDVWLQLGIVGLAIFIVFIGLALVRAWIVASNRRAVTHVWPALLLVLIVVTSAAESFALVEIGWFCLVICVVRAAQELSWRRGLRAV